MPSNLKKLVRARMAETGEGWQVALMFVRSQAIVRSPTPREKNEGSSAPSNSKITLPNKDLLP